jgi:hypothetical protein
MAGGNITIDWKNIFFSVNYAKCAAPFDSLFPLYSNNSYSPLASPHTRDVRGRMKIMIIVVIAKNIIFFIIIYIEGSAVSVNVESGWRAQKRKKESCCCNKRIELFMILNITFYIIMSFDI